MSGFLVSKTGEELQFVRDASKYVAAGWKIVGEGEEFRPRECCEFVGGKWTSTPKKKAEHAAAVARNLLLIDPASMLAKVEALEQRIAALEAERKQTPP